MTPTSLLHPPADPAALAARLVCRLLLVLALSLGLGTTAHAQKPRDVTPGEMALLPAYCPDTQGFGYGDASFNTSPRAAYWIRLMDAKSFWALHHYCWALIRIRRADGIGVPPVIRDGMLRGALADYNYVLEHGSPDFVLLPEILMRRGELLLRLNDVGGAMESFEASVQRKPDYWPSYVRWAEFLVSLKRHKEAQAFLERGLTAAPDTPQLRAAYKKAGGDPVAFVSRLPPRRPAAEAADAPASASAPAHPDAASSAPPSPPSATPSSAPAPATAASGGR